MKIDDKNIGKFFQEQLKDVEVQPDATVWSGIKLQAGIATVSYSLYRYMAMAAVVLVAVSSYFVWSYFSEQDHVVVDKPIEVVQEMEVPVKKEMPAENIEEAPVNDIKKPITAQKEVLNKAVVATPVAKKPTKKNAEKNKQQAEIASEYSQSNSNAVKIETKPAVVKPIIEKSPTTKPEIKSKEEPIAATPMNEEIPAINSQDSVKISFSNDPTICFGEDAILQVEGGVSYDWNTGAHGPKLKVSPVENSDYWVIVIDRFGNEIKHTFNVYIDRECTAIFVPSAFTPNGDGINDVFKAEGLGIRSFEMLVFNREGQIVFESRNIEDAWDGSYRNAPSLARIYFYHLSYTDAKGNPHKKRGQVTLIR